MCGIVAYVGNREAYPLIIKGLKRLEYRGYDSAGIAVMNKKGLSVYKKKGKVADLEQHVGNSDVVSNIGIGHTRWATHGEPNDANAHPHYSHSKSLAIIHNGIIENYDSLKKNLQKKGYEFHSDTDSEVFVNFIEDIKKQTNCKLEEAVRLAMQEVVGAYAIVVMTSEDPTQLIAARKGSPLVIGVGENEYFFASDATPIVEYTKEVIYLNDFEIAVVQKGELTVKNIDNILQSPYVQTVELELAAIEKGGYEHFMLKEIFEQPRSVADCMRGRVNAESASIVMGGIRDYADKLAKANRITIVACGTSWHAGLVAEYVIEELRIPVEVEYASEFRYRNPIINQGDVVIAISQSGETADTLAAIELAKSKGAIIIGICNVVGSSIPRATHAGAYTHAGPEIGVASTKAFTAQVVTLTQMAIFIAKQKGSIMDDRFRTLLWELEKIPQKIERVLNTTEQASKLIANVFKDATNFIYLGRGYNFPVALEGALKLKEISYIHAEGYPAAEMKHGPIALIDQDMPVVVIALQDSSYEKVVSNLQEVKARKGKVIAIITEGDKHIPGMADYVLEIPKTDELLTPLLSVIPLQLLSYYIAVLRGCNVDQPRNLAKSVTVE